MDDQLLLFLTIGAVVLLALMVLVIRIGLKNSRADDLMAVPPLEELTDAGDGKRIAVLPERPDVVVEKAPSVLNPDRPKDDAAVGGLTGAEVAGEEAADAPKPKPSPWDKPAEIGDAETESSYSEDALMEREIKAMLLQDRPDRAVAHVMAVKKVDEAEAERIVAGYADADGG